jgi:uncharacterized Zn finger protein
MTSYNTTDLFLKLERPALERAARRLTPRPFVRRTGDRQYTVSGSRGAVYTVTIKTIPGGVIGHCSCPATQICRHQVAALIFEQGVA